MPIRPENRDRYPKDWPEISRRIRHERAGNKCEFCGVDNGALGGRRSDGVWMPAQPTGDNGLSLTWPLPGDWGWCGDSETQGQAHLRIVRIVLTVAHLDHTPEHCEDDNLKALCQRCHNLYDAAKRRQGIKERQRASAACGDLIAADPPKGAEG